jgi:SAM-dependent methyltransferase
MSATRADEPVGNHAGVESSRVSCPACGAPCTHPPLYRFTAAAAAAHFCPATRDADRNLRLLRCIRRLWQGEEAVVLRCGACGFGFGLPFVGGDEEFYGILHEQQGYPSWRWDYDVAMAEAVSRRNGGRILDFGAGVGMFLRRLGTEWERFAVEGSESTRRQLEAAGITVFRDLAQAASSEAGTFQIVTLFQVLEHLAEFNAVLEKCHRLLAQGGLLVVTVPDLDAMIRQQQLTGCHDMLPNHINKWTAESLSGVLRRVGFVVGLPIPEAPSWQHVKASLHLKLMNDATRQHSMAAAVYRIRNKRLRAMSLACLAVPALLSMLPDTMHLRLGGAFGLVGVKQ